MQVFFTKKKKLNRINNSKQLKIRDSNENRIGNECEKEPEITEKLNDIGYLLFSEYFRTLKLTISKTEKKSFSPTLISVC